MIEATTKGAGPSGTLRSWLVAVTPPPPPSLAARLAAVLEPFADRPEHEVPECCLEAGEGLLDAILASGSTSRDTALDLLTVDALITYAFQEAAGEPERLEARATRAMERIAAIPQREPT